MMTDGWTEIGTTDPDNKVGLAPPGTPAPMYFDETHYFHDTGELYPINGGSQSLKDLALSYEPHHDWWENLTSPPDPIVIPWPMSWDDKIFAALYGLSGAKAELLYRLNETWSGRNPGKPVSWKGL